MASKLDDHGTKHTDLESRLILITGAIGEIKPLLVEHLAKSDQLREDFNTFQTTTNAELAKLRRNNSANGGSNGHAAI